MPVLVYLAFFRYWASLLTVWYPASINRRAGREVLVLPHATKLLWAVIVMVIPIIGVLVVSRQLMRYCRQCGSLNPFPGAPGLRGWPVIAAGGERRLMTDGAGGRKPRGAVRSPPTRRRSDVTDRRRP